MATTPCEGIWNIAKPHSSAPTQSNKSDPTIRLWKFLHNHKGNLSRWGWFSFVTWDSLPIFDPGLHLEFILHDAIYMLWEARIVNRVQLRSCPIFAVLTKKHMTGSKVFWEEWWSICRDMLGRQLRGSFGSLLWMSPQGFAVSGSAKSRNGTYENCIVVYHFHAVNIVVAVCRTWWQVEVQMCILLADGLSPVLVIDLPWVPRPLWLNAFITN